MNLSERIRGCLESPKTATQVESELGVDAHTLWAMAQLAPGEGIEDGVQRIEEALAATGKQQVGEVQGDARAQFKAWWDATRPLEGGALHYEIAWTAWQAALAARQPGAQGPKFTTEDGPCWHHAGKAFIVTVDGDSLQLMVTDGPRIEFIGDSRPYRVPAQGIDLGQFRDLMGFAVLQAVNLPETDPRRDFIRQASELMALIEGQRDAAPGV